MKKILYLVTIFLILNTFLFTLSNLILKKKVGITEKFTFIEHCYVSSLIEQDIDTLGIKHSLFYDYWREYGGHCTQLENRDSLYTFVFKDLKKRKIFLDQINSKEFKNNILDNLDSQLLIDKKLLTQYTLILENIITNDNMLSRLENDFPLQYKNYMNIISMKKMLTKRIKKNGKILNELRNIDIFEIQNNKITKPINFFNFKFSFFLSLYLYPILLFIFYIFRKKELGFYRN